MDGYTARVAALRARERCVFHTQVRFNVQKCLRPERDVNAWLAATLADRDAWVESSELLHYAIAAPFSVLPEPQATAAFALRVLFDEAPESAGRLEGEFSALVVPVLQLVRSGAFSAVWRERNPWTARRHPEIAESIALTMRDLPGVADDCLDRFH